MTSLAAKADERVVDVKFTTDSLVVSLADGRRISAPLAWYPRLAEGSEDERACWQVCGGGFGVHWPQLDEDLSTEGLLRGARGPKTPNS